MPIVLQLPQSSHGSTAKLPRCWQYCNSLTCQGHVGATLYKFPARGFPKTLTWNTHVRHAATPVEFKGVTRVPLCLFWNLEALILPVWNGLVLEASRRKHKRVNRLASWVSGETDDFSSLSLTASPSLLGLPWDTYIRVRRKPYSKSQASLTQDRRCIDP